MRKAPKTVLVHLKIVLTADDKPILIILIAINDSYYHYFILIL